MKSVTKKFFAMLLGAVLCVLPAVTAMAADEEGSFNKLSDTVYQFDIDESELSGTYLSKMGGVYFRDHAGNTDAANTVSRTTVDNMSAVDIQQGDGTANGKNIQIPTYFGTEGTPSHGKDLTKLHIAFRIKRTLADAQWFGLTLRDLDATSGGGAALIVGFKSGQISLFGTNVHSYTLGKWYDVDITVDLETRYGVLKVKGKDDDTWSSYCRAYEKLYGNAAASTVVNTTNADWISFNFMENDKTEKHVYLTNFMQNTYGGSLTLISDDFSASNEEHKAHYKWGNASGKNDAYLQSTSKDADSLNGVWIFQNNGSTFTTEHVPYGDDYASKISQTGVQSDLMKLPFNGNEPDVARQRIRFKTAGNVTPNTDESQGAINFGIYTRESTEEKATHSGLVRILRNDLQIQKADNKYQGVINNMEEEPLQLYDVEIVYDKNTHLLETAVVDGSGVQHTQSRTLSENAKGISRFAISGNSINAGGTGVRYLDDFSWEFLSEHAGSDSVTADIASEGVQDALLDESIIVSADETLNLPKCLESVTVKNAEALMEKDRDYTLKQKDGKLYIDFVDLEPKTEYNISIDGIALMGGEIIDGVTASFMTTGNTISVTKPELKGGNIESTASAPYANGKSVLLIAALYKNDQLIEVLTKEGSATSESKTLSISRADFKKLGEGTRIRAFVWNNFADMVPYSGAADIAVQ